MNWIAGYIAGAIFAAMIIVAGNAIGLWQLP